MTEQGQLITTLHEAESPPQRKIAWSKEDQAFRIVDERGPERYAVKQRRSLTSARSADSLEESVKAFGSSSEDTANDRDLEELLELRCQILDQILATPLRQPALRLLPLFLLHWRGALDRIVSCNAQLQLSQRVVALVCEELQLLAETEMLVGFVVLARAALGKSIRLARQHELDTKDIIVADAKRVLINCIQFQEQLKLCAAGLKRQNTPLSIQREILGILKQLHRLAPHSVDVMGLYAGVMMDMHRSRDVVPMLSTFAFTESDAQLTLLHVRALEYEGFYNDSLSTATAFCDQHVTLEDEKPTMALATHVQALGSVLMSKAAAEDALRQSQFDEAESEFSEALRRTQTKSRKLRAALLLGRANAHIALERLLSARRDLEESIELDATNQLTRLRLRTVHLALETQRIQQRLL